MTRHTNHGLMVHCEACSTEVILAGPEKFPLPMREVSRILAKVKGCEKCGAPKDKIVMGPARKAAGVPV